VSLGPYPKRVCELQLLRLREIVNFVGVLGSSHNPLGRSPKSVFTDGVSWSPPILKFAQVLDDLGVLQLSNQIKSTNF